MRPIFWVLIPLLAEITYGASITKNNVEQNLIDEKLEDVSLQEHQRIKRSRQGQTQSQYINFGDAKTEGKADAEITRFGSRASVSGSNGMGQAQSQSSGGDCGDCAGADSSYAYESTNRPDPLRSISSSSNGYPQKQASSSGKLGFDAFGRPIQLPSAGVIGGVSQGNPLHADVENIGWKVHGIPSTVYTYPVISGDGSRQIGGIPLQHGQRINGQPQPGSGTVGGLPSDINRLQVGSYPDSGNGRQQLTGGRPSSSTTSTGSGLQRPASILNRPSTSSGNTGSGNIPQTSNIPSGSGGGYTQGIPQTNVPSGSGSGYTQGIPQTNLPSSNIPSGSGGGYTQGIPQTNLPSGSGSGYTQGIPQTNVPSGSGSGYAQGIPQTNLPSSNIPSGSGGGYIQGIPQTNLPSGSGSGYAQGIPQTNLPSSNIPSGSGGGYTQGIPQTNLPSGSGSGYTQGIPQTNIPGSILSGTIPSSVSSTNYETTPNTSGRGYTSGRPSSGSTDLYPNQGQATKPGSILNGAYGPQKISTSGNRQPASSQTGQVTSESYPIAPDTSDVYGGLRKAFKLPPGLCLVRCDTLRSDQYSLTPEQARDAFISSGVLGPSGADNVNFRGQVGSPEQGRIQPQQPGTRYSISGTQPTGNLPSASQIAQGGQTQTGGQTQYPSENVVSHIRGQVPTGSDAGPTGRYPTVQYPSQSGALPSTTSVGQYPSQTTQQVGQSPLTGAGQYPSQTTSSLAPGQYPSHSSQYPAQTGSVAQYPSQSGIPSVQSGLPTGSVSTSDQYPTQHIIQGVPSGQYQNQHGIQTQPSVKYPGQITNQQGYPIQQGVQGIQYPIQGGIPTSSTGQQYPTQQGVQGIQYPSQGGIPTSSTGQQYPTQQGVQGVQYPSQGGVPTTSTGQQYPTQQGIQYPSQGGVPTTSTGQQYPTQQGVQGVQYPSQGGVPTTSTGQQYPTQQGVQAVQYPSQGGVPTTSTGQQYPTHQGVQYPSQGGIQTTSTGQQYPTQQGVQYPIQGGIPTSSTGQQYPTQQGVQGIQYPSQGGVPTTSTGQQYPTQQGVQYPSQGRIPTSSTVTGQQYPTQQGGQGVQYPIQGGIPTTSTVTGQQYPTQQGVQGVQYPSHGGIPTTSTVTGQQYPTQQGVQGIQYPGQHGIQTPSGIIAQYPGQIITQHGIPTTVITGQQPNQQGIQGIPTISGQGVQPGVSAGQYPNAGVSLWSGGQGLPTQYVSGGLPVGAGLIGQPQLAQGTVGIPGLDTVIQPGVSSGDSNPPSNYVQGSSSTGTAEDDAFSQAESSIKNGEIVASAQGTKDGGTAQTQVQGTYSGTGTFSASAQTADKDRSAQAQVSGHKDGALSSSQGTGGTGKSQAQVEVNEKTGGTSATSQGGGSAHSSQSSVVANEKGGLADSQGSGPGQTSSQAQIGFRPESNSPNQAGNIFNGGGQASAQSGSHSGQSQTQIQGNFKYGISYHGAAQSASGTKEQVASYREKNKKLFEAIGQYSRSNRDAVTASSDIANINDIGSRPGTSLTLAPSVSNAVQSEDGQFPDDDDYEADEGEDEYTEDYDSSDKPDNETTPRNKHRSSDHVEIKLPSIELTTTTSKLGKIETSTHKVSGEQSISEQSVRFPAVRSEIIPDGFKGKIEEKKHQSKGSKNLFDKDNAKPDTFVTVTKSVSGSLDGGSKTPSDDKQFASTYYTKSSTCGYFTFSCNIVYGSNGRSKICRPKAPTNGKC